MSGTISGYQAGAIDWRAVLFGTRAPGWSILIRLLVGLVVFLPEGFQKLAFPDMLGAGRFANIGIPYPELMGPFVGMVEAVCGALIILGLLTQARGDPADRHYDRGDRLDQGADPARARFLDFPLPKLPRYGFLSMMHEARADFDHAAWDRSTC